MSVILKSPGKLKHYVFGKEDSLTEEEHAKQLRAKLSKILKRPITTRAQVERLLEQIDDLRLRGLVK